jgi:hypothetical protein
MVWQALCGNGRRELKSHIGNGVELQPTRGNSDEQKRRTVEPEIDVWREVSAVDGVKVAEWWTEWVRGSAILREAGEGARRDRQMSAVDQRRIFGGGFLRKPERRRVFGRQLFKKSAQIKKIVGHTASHWSPGNRRTGGTEKSFLISFIEARFCWGNEVRAKCGLKTWHKYERR